MSLPTYDFSDTQQLSWSTARSKVLMDIVDQLITVLNESAAIHGSNIAPELTELRAAVRYSSSKLDPVRALCNVLQIITVHQAAINGNQRATVSDNPTN